MCAHTREIKESVKVYGQASAVWALIGDFNGLYRWHPAVLDSQLEGQRHQPGCLRNLTLPDGSHLQEKLVSLDDDAMQYRYSVTMGPLPVQDYESEIRVQDNGDGSCSVNWCSSFIPSGVPASLADKIVRNIYQTGLNNLARLFN